ncbi:MAG: 50S ribosomal protein L21 [Xanthomonadales bacterium]|nr:50S ribosomal protein L21 [Xanthomonadales bacterium]NIX13356.1 50S ribosomal protein L21 [Xanthomonadales bacterium]
MFAVFSTGGKQYRATTGDIVKVEKLDVEKGATVELDQVLMVGEGDDVKIGTPYLAGGKVTAKVVEHGRGEKVKIIKFKRRKQHLKRQGHRQYFTALEITGINAEAPKAKKPAKADDQPEEVAEKKPVKKAAPKKTAAKKKVAKKTAAKKAATKEAKGEE